jgi:UDP-N-acetylmuramoyl-tripeptide--D-alanyl-D-alanine ligase
MSAPTFTAASLARFTNGRLVGADVLFDTVSTDTRTLQPGALFVALKGPNFDGHEYVQAAAERGAVYWSNELPVTLPQVVVPDALAGLSQFAHAWRMQFSLSVIGVTGSNGKTTTKEMLGSILAELGPVW